jgi:hypothetical protein
MNRKIMPSKRDLQKLEDRYRKAREINDRFIPSLQQAIKFCSPISDGLNILNSFDDEGKDSSIDVNNEIPQAASMQRSKKLHSILCPTNKKWGTAYTKHDGVEIYNQKVTDFIFNEIKNSNIHQVLDSFFLDYNIGCAALFVCSSQNENKPIIFKNISGVTLMPEYSDDPTDRNCWWRTAISWKELNELNPKLAIKYQKEQNDKIYITCGFLKHENQYIYVQFVKEDFDEALTYEIRPFNQLILVNDTLRPGESRGRGVILQILQDIVRLNSLTENRDKSVAYNNMPTQLTSANSDIDYQELHEMTGKIIPGGLDQMGGKQIEPLFIQTDLNSSTALIKELELKVQQYFNVMPLGQIDDTPVRTATEVSIRKADSERELIAVVARSSNQLIIQLMEAIYHISVERKLLEVDKNQEMIFKFDSPEIDMQSADDLDAMLKAAEIVNQIAGQGAYQSMIDPQKVTSQVNEKLKIPQEIMKSSDQLAAQYQAMQQMMSQQQGKLGQQQAFEPVKQQGPVAINPTQLGQNMTIDGMGR